MILPIVQLGDPVLRTGTRRLKKAEITAESTRTLVESMRETMYAAPGVGLAAPQIGSDWRLAVLEDKTEFIEIEIEPDSQEELVERSPLPFTVMINASYQPIGKETRTFFEGCLSMLGYRALVRRWARVLAHFTDIDGKQHSLEFSGWPARIVQHEIDHLDGIVYVDRCETRTLTTLHNMDYWANLSTAEICQQLNLNQK